MIKNFQKCFAEIKDIEMKKLYNEFLGDLEKMKNEYDKNDDELIERYKNENLKIYNYKGITLGDSIEKIYPLMKIYHTEYRRDDRKVGSEMTTELCEKYDLLDVDDVDTGEIYYYPEKGFMHAEFCVNPEDVISKINKITFSIDVEIPSENNVEDALKAKKIEDIYYSLYNFGEIEIEIENKEIIGKLEGSIFTFDLLSGNLKNIEIKK